MTVDRREEMLPREDDEVRSIGGRVQTPHRFTWHNIAKDQYEDRFGHCVNYDKCPTRSPFILPKNKRFTGLKAPTCRHLIF